MEKENKNKLLVIIGAFFVIIISIILVALLSDGLSDKKVAKISKDVSVVENNDDGKVKEKTTYSEAEFQQTATGFVKTITNLGYDIPGKEYTYLQAQTYHKDIRVQQCRASFNYLSSNLKEAYSCEKNLNVVNNPMYSIGLVKSEATNINLTKSQKIDDETFRFLFNVNLKFSQEKLKKTDASSDGSTFKSYAEQNVEGLYVDVRNNQIVKTNADEVLKNGSTFWNGESYLTLDWKIDPVYQKEFEEENKRVEELLSKTPIQE